MKIQKKNVILLTSLTAVFAVAISVYSSLQSSTYLVQTVEVIDPLAGEREKESPVSSQTIIDLAAVPLGKVSLFSLDLDKVEERILSHPWIREVQLTKRFPGTLSVSVVFRDPKALIQRDNGSLAYVDSNGKVFGSLNLRAQPDLPMIEGVAESNANQVRDALSVVKSWESSSISPRAELASITYSESSGYRAHIKGASLVQPTLWLGKNLVQDGETLDDRFGRMSQVLDYLQRHNIPARQIRADIGKKIVVKIARGS